MGASKNDGQDDVEYDFEIDHDHDGNDRVSHILNEACLVLYFHKDGNWQASCKERYASELAAEFQKYPELSSRVLGSKDRVVKMVAYKALEKLKG